VSPGDTSAALKGDVVGNEKAARVIGSDVTHGLIAGFNVAAAPNAGAARVKEKLGNEIL